MNLNFRKTVLLMSACTALGFCYSPQVFAASNSAVAAVQQSKNVQGTVSDATGPVIGASIMEKGTSNGTVTDLDGNFTLNVKPGATLVISYIGYKTQEVAVGNKAQLPITLVSNDRSLDEVVVIGYGTMKKKLVTGATVQVKGDDIAKLNTTNVLGALQSQSPGLSIVQTSGQPGEQSYKVNVRGLGTVGNASPLYVIDGFPGGDINSLNPSDIESIDVLKDAASAAIYGARAANGVVLVTTKQGKAGKLQISYDGYIGFQYLYKHPDVLNAKEYMYAYDLMNWTDGSSLKDWKSMLPSSEWDQLQNGWEGTDWVDESYHKGAIKTNHSIGLQGGNDISKFSLGFSYTKQDGIFGEKRQSKFERYNARLNSDHVLYKVGNLEVIKLGENFTFNHTGNSGISTGNLYSNNMHDLLIGSPLLPAYNASGDYYSQTDMIADGWGLDKTAINPLIGPAKSSQGLKESKSYGINMNVYAEIQPIKNLKLRSQFSYRMGTSTYRSYTEKYVNGSTAVTTESVSQNMSTWSNLAWENTLSYKLIAGLHNADFVVGNSIETNSYGMSMGARGMNTLFPEDWSHAYLSNTKPASVNDIIGNGSFYGYPNGDSSLASFFGRASYNYNETYMAQFTLRTDGSSNFKKGHRWGVFPSASIGWVATNEKFMESTKSWMDFLKLRASWGQNGNCNISNFQYLTSFKFDESNGYFFGNPSGQEPAETTGAYADVLKNEDLKWETSEQIDLGIDARFLNSRLGFTFDWYRKTTKDWLVQAPILSVYGLNAPYINGGDVRNTGIEIGLNWNDRIGKDFTYGAAFNFANNKNKVTRIANTEGIIHGPSDVYMQGVDEIYRAKVGEPIGYFYGMRTAGVFQNQAQIDEWKKTYTDEIHGGNPVPGDVIYVDNNGDGKVNLEDRTKIGDPHPDCTIGFNLHAEYKGFDFSITGNGSFGQQVVRSSNTGNSQVENLNKKLLYGCWKGEGTSNFLPALHNLANVNWKTFSEIWLEDADYVRIQNVTVGYDFCKIWKNSPFTQCRLYLAAENLFTFTGYSGMDPEIGASGNDSYSWAQGIDLGFYPVPRTYMVGVNIKF